MIKIRRAAERGHTQLNWLDSYHTFSFGDYYDPENRGFRTLRVINDDRISPAQGFGMHPHRDMEIVTCVFEGELKHEDSLGNGSVIKPGEIQRMTAGTGITHSEYNASDTEEVHLLQIWILPEKKGLRPGYEQKTLPAGAGDGFKLAASREGRGGSVRIHQDAEIWMASLAKSADAAHRLSPGRHAWVQLARGAGELNGTKLAAGDGAQVSGESLLEFRASQKTDLLLFDLA